MDDETHVLHRTGRLVLATHSSQGTTYREFELVNRFMSEFEDVASEVSIDLDQTMVDVDPLVGRFVAGLIVEQFGVSRDPGEHVRQLMSLLLWLFMMGREHALRGYDCPSAYEGDAFVTGLVIDSAFDEPSWSGLAEVRTGFAAEFREVAEDVFLDYRYTLLDIDDEVGRRVDLFVVELVRLSRSDPALMVSHLLSAARWMFMLGRAHASRGYQAPVQRYSESPDIPDTIEDL